MNILLVCGTHPRHRFLIEDVFKKSANVDVITFVREPLVPEVLTGNINKSEKALQKHFRKRNIVETEIYGVDTVEDLLDKSFCAERRLIVTKNDFNSEETYNFLKSRKYDLTLLMGPGIVSAELKNLLGNNIINIHLGLSPWYRGSGTMFWPTFNWEPWKTGTTFHRINKHADAGNIIHQTIVSAVRPSDGIHDTAGRAVSDAKLDLPTVMEFALSEPMHPGIEQPFVGRSHLTTQICAQHAYDIHVLRKDATAKIITDLGIKPSKFKKYSVITDGTNV